MKEREREGKKRARERVRERAREKKRRTNNSRGTKKEHPFQLQSLHKARGRQHERDRETERERDREGKRKGERKGEREKTRRAEADKRRLNVFTSCRAPRKQKGGSAGEREEHCKLKNLQRAGQTA